MPPMVTPRRASLRSQANTYLSLKVAGLPPAQTNSMSTSRSEPAPTSGMMARPFEAMTGLPPGAACHQR
jgi:hypothetical protein